MNALPYVHYTDHYLLSPQHPITVSLIGAGGTGSQLLTCLARMHQAMLALDYPGLQVRVFDDDTVSPANLGRQLFAECEIGMNKGVALVNRINRFFGTGWKAIPHRFTGEASERLPEEGVTNLYLSCVDTAKARFEIAGILKEHTRPYHGYRSNQALYWMDLGNSRSTGQVILSTIGERKQPASQQYQAVGQLPFVTDTFGTLLQEADTSDNTPSCSLAEALTRQDLFINSTLANMGASLLWQLFREGFITNRGFFLNLHDFRVQPLKVTPAVEAASKAA